MSKWIETRVKEIRERETLESIRQKDR